LKIVLQNRTARPPINLQTTANPQAREQWTRGVQKIQAEISRGSIAKAVLARTKSIHANEWFNSAPVLEKLARNSAGCYLFAHRMGESCFLGASPERLFRLTDRMIMAESLAGTRPRGETGGDDDALAAELLASEKERHEQATVTEHIRAVLNRWCDHVQTNDAPCVRKLQHVQHLSTEIRGNLRDMNTLDSLLAELHPTPAVCGVPRESAQQLLQNIEPIPRGLYAGALGWISLSAAEFAVTIRSALLNRQTATIFAGAGITALSNAEAEWEETRNKMQPMMQALNP
jgi:isochorismate synthase